MNTLTLPASVPALLPPNPPTLHRIIGAASGLSSCWLAALILFSGCVTTSPLDRAAKSLASTVAAVDSAMTGYADLVALDLVPVRDQVQVAKLYADYQAAESVAEAALVRAVKSKDAGSLASATAALDAAKLPLLKFLARFTKAPPEGAQ